MKRYAVLIEVEQEAWQRARLQARHYGPFDLHEFDKWCQQQAEVLDSSTNEGRNSRL